MNLLDAAAHSEHELLIWCDIWPRSVARSRDGENPMRMSNP
jgi:hypothetical protein